MAARSTQGVHPTSMTLDRAALRDLCEIVAKAVGDDPKGHVHTRFQAAGKGEAVSASVPADFADSRLPAYVEELLLTGSSNHHDVRVWLHSCNLFGHSRIEVESDDSEWLDARVQELQRFLADHRNQHWVVHQKRSVLSLSAVLGVLTIAVWGDLREWWALSLAFAVAWGFLYEVLLAPAFPFVLVESERPHSLHRVRGALRFMGPALFIGLVLAVLIRALGI